MLSPHEISGSPGKWGLKKLGGFRINDNFKSLKKALQKLATREIDYFYYHDLALLYLLKESDLPLRAVPTIFRRKNHWMIYSKKSDSTDIAAVEEELGKMVKSGEIEKIWDRYKP